MRGLAQIYLKIKTIFRREVANIVCFQRKYDKKNKDDMKLKNCLFLYDIEEKKLRSETKKKRKKTTHTKKPMPLTHKKE